MKEDPKPPRSHRPQLPGEWDAVVLKALAKDPRRRFQSANEMKSAIEALGTEALDIASRPRPAKLFAAAAAAFLIVAFLASMLGYSAMAGSGRASVGSYLAEAAARGQLSGTVLVARHGKVLLDQGYGYADLATHRRNDASTEYGLANATTTALMVGDALQGTQSITGISPNNVAASMTNLWWSLCTQFSQADYGGVRCRRDWSGLTVANLVDGTAGFSNYRTGAKGDDVVTAWTRCLSLPVRRPIPGQVNYSTCDDIILGTPGADRLPPWPRYPRGHMAAYGYHPGRTEHH